MGCIAVVVAILVGIYVYGGNRQSHLLAARYGLAQYGSNGTDIQYKGFYAREKSFKTSEQLVSQSSSAKRPLTTLQKSTKKKVTVRLKNEVEYKGKMDNVDSYMNLIMTDAEELHDGKTIANYGRVIVRGNNVLFIKLENEL